MSTKLSGKVTIITGSGSGYGAGIATRFVAEGARVVIADLSGENAKKVAEQLGCSWVQADVTKRLGWEAILKKAISTYGGVDVVVNNAGACYKNKVMIDLSQ
jgi:NAD(P)-dependent dehydrogenase (short-subunit alcohol dehydrogenase family)